MEKYGFIIGNWYKYIENNKSNYYIRIQDVFEVERVDSGRFRKIYFSEKIQNNKHSLQVNNGGNFWANTQMETIALENPVNIEEIKDLLPENHPDLLKILKQSYEYLIPILIKYQIK